MLLGEAIVSRWNDQYLICIRRFLPGGEVWCLRMVGLGELRWNTEFGYCDFGSEVSHSVGKTLLFVKVAVRMISAVG